MTQVIDLSTYLARNAPSADRKRTREDLEVNAVRRIS